MKGPNNYIEIYSVTFEFATYSDNSLDATKVKVQKPQLVATTKTQLTSAKKLQLRSILSSSMIAWVDSRARQLVLMRVCSNTEFFK